VSGLRDPLPEHDHIAVLGLGVSGKAACQLLAEFGKTVRATDSREDINTSGLPDHIEIALGTNDTAGATAAVLSPGLNPNWPENAENPALSDLWERARRGELELLSELDVAARAFRGKKIAIGGTDGKSTTAAFTKHLLDTLGVDALLGGNSWTALSEAVLENSSADVAVIEASAFQLWDGHRFAPDVSVLTNIALDHLDHFATFDDYVAAKGQLLTHADEQTTVALHANDERLMSFVPELTESGVNVCTFGEQGDVDVSADHLHWKIKNGETRRVDLREFKLPGLHNRRNVAAAWIAVDAVSGEYDAVEVDRALADAVTSFRGLPHRIEFVAENDGIRFYNDSKATNVHSACVAYRAMERPFVAIVGGVDKQLDLAPLIDILAQRATHVVTIGELRDRFRSEGKTLSAKLSEAESLRDALHMAVDRADSGIDIVFSPACSSFDMFRSFEHRGEVFVDLVREFTEEQ
jgi:UDP-N-acetylmuramoylalanine--D-glutamate ligase